VAELPELYVNPGQISQLFQNLISNALKFSRKNIAPKISITYDINNTAVGPPVNGNKYISIYIRDNGIGFDESYLDQMFTLFKRLHDHTEYEGTGIGLAICKKIVEQHKGIIRATSKLDEGSTFIISLPYTQQQYDFTTAERQLERSHS
jgi:signal transduction histidine kinase